MVDPMTGQTYQLFTADEATRNNHAMFAQYVKTDPQVRQELDQAYSQALRPQDARRLDAEGRSQSGSDLALRDAAKDFTDMKNQPANVQWAVLAQLRQTRQTNQQELARLDQALKASPLSPETQAQRTQIVLQMEDLMRRDQALLVGIQAQLLDMGQTGSKLLNPGQYAEWTEGFGEARASAGLNFRGVSNANLSARSAMSREAVAERQALVQAEQAAVRAKIENNFYADGVRVDISLLPKQQAEALANLNGKQLQSGWTPQRVYDEVINVPKGQRPPPESYLSASEIDSHLNLFSQGAIRFTSREGAAQYGTVGPDGGFVIPKKEFDKVLNQSNGDLRIVEKKLGLEPGYLGDKDTMVVLIKPQDIRGLRMPSGNESGANKLWVPGGYTSGGIPEAIMNFSHKPSVIELKLKVN
jgi:hypothetical protein